MRYQYKTISTNNYIDLKCDVFHMLARALFRSSLHLHVYQAIALALLSLAFLSFPQSSLAASNNETLREIKEPDHPPLKIVSLAPHLTEWAFSLGLGGNLVGVSDYSDYPKQARSIERVADFQGADISAIVSLQPDLILAWDGGNKPQDIHKLSSMGIKVFRSHVESIADIAHEIKKLGAITGTEEKAMKLSDDFIATLNALEDEYAQETLKPVFYYSWTTPLMSIGPNAWANKLLHVCGARSIFEDSPVDYPQVGLKEVLTRQPQVLIAASKHSPMELEAYWSEHRSFLTAPLIVVNPDITSRFSLRLINELKVMCEGIKQGA